ncbi:hypothetical protein FRB90_003118 [Tulasnella sp. 427]|nr:hypothetical protein FRB90_003118 [Tulasnella sp. 427]
MSSVRAQKSLGLVGGAPDYNVLEGYPPPEATARTYKYTSDGKLFAVALPSCVRISNATDFTTLCEIPVPNALEIGFSPKGTYISTWERYVKPADEMTQHKNHRVWRVSDGREVISFVQKSLDNWDLQYTPSEDKAVRLVSSEVQVYLPSDWAKGIVDRLRLEGLSAIAPGPGQYPALAVFVGERKGAPATVKVYNLAALSAPPTCSKTFFKADKCTIKWNNLGTQVLVLTSTDVDKSNKNYYGETNLYLLSAAGNFDCRVTLDKEGPIHDFTWSPNSKEFGVIYGFMPAKTVLFDQRVKVIHDFGIHPRNFISFNPQGRLLALAGFGNLAGKVDIFDRRSLTKVCEIDAPNTSWCEWSPDGRSLLTATLSPRLRVDNGIKIWHCTGTLVHVHMVDELYQASWRPAPIETATPFGNTLPAAPKPSASVETYQAGKPTPTKPAGAYRPPGARGALTPSIFKREDEGGTPRSDSSSTPSRNGTQPGPSGRPTPPAHTGSPVPGAAPGQGIRGRVVPGAAPRHPPGWVPPENGDKKKKQRTKKGKEAEDGTANPTSSPKVTPRAGGSGVQTLAGSGTPRAGTPAGGNPTGRSVPQALDLSAARSTPSGSGDAPTPGTGTGEGLDPAQKKIRNLTKKLKAIDELKEKRNRGEKMEATQLKKIEGEAGIHIIVNQKLGNCVPVFVQLPADLLTPVLAYLRIAKDSKYSFMLESVTGGQNVGRYSFIGADPFKVIRTGPGQEFEGDPMAVLQKELQSYKYVKIPEIPTFTGEGTSTLQDDVWLSCLALGGAIGYVAYDCIHYFEPKTKPTNFELEDTLKIPESVMMLCDTLIVFDHLYQSVKAVSHVIAPVNSTASDVPFIYSTAVSKARRVAKLLLASSSSNLSAIPQPPIVPNQPAVSNVGKDGYMGFVTKLKERIVAGDIIQAVPSQRLRKETALHPFNAYRQLRQVNPSPYMFYLDCGDLQLVGASPETLCKVERSKVYNHAIAGTVRRGKTPEEDAELGGQLLKSVKDRAEHIMLVDLARNDVNRVCEPLTVKVDELMKLEKFSHVIHMTSQVSGKLREGKTRQIKAIELIAGLERERRGVYAGAVGRFDFADDEMDVCIAIRTMTFKDGAVYLQAGGGIVFDSNEEEEYIETINKLGANMRAIEEAEKYQMALQSDTKPSPA